MAGGRVIDTCFVRGGEPSLRTREMIGSCSVYVVRHARDSYIVTPLLSLEAAAPKNKNNPFDAVIHAQESPPHKRFSVGCISPFMRLAEHHTAIRAWCKQCGSDR